MRIVEYKMIIKDSGEKTHPMFIKDFGYFFNDKTYIGVIPEEEDLDYYIPLDQIKVLSLNDLIDRSKTEQFKPSSFNRICDENGVVLDLDSLTNFITEWWNKKVLTDGNH